MAVTSGDPGAAGDVLMVACAERERSCGQVSARGGRLVAVCGASGASGARRVGMRTGDEGRGCG